MFSAPIGWLRLALLFPLFALLVVIDAKAHWAALGLYLLFVVGGVVEARFRPAGVIGAARVFDVGEPLLTLVAMLGLSVGGASIGASAASAILVGRVLIRQSLATGRNLEIGRVDRAVSVLTVLSFVLMIAPRIPFTPRTVDTHRAGGWLLMACGLAGLILLVGDLRRARDGAPSGRA